MKEKLVISIFFVICSLFFKNEEKKIEQIHFSFPIGHCDFSQAMTCLREITQGVYMHSCNRAIVIAGLGRR